jgi:hypothetical protein
MSRKVLFAFDERSHAGLMELKKRAGFQSLGETVREAVRLTHTLQSQSLHGFSEIIVRNPDTKEQRVLVMPSLVHESTEEEKAFAEEEPPLITSR